jgi:hypothetical protein
VRQRLKIGMKYQDFDIGCDEYQWFMGDLQKQNLDIEFEIISINVYRLPTGFMRYVIFTKSKKYLTSPE